MSATMDAARAIIAGETEIMIAAGVDDMEKVYAVDLWEEGIAALRGKSSIRSTENPYRKGRGDETESDLHGCCVLCGPVHRGRRPVSV
jgi:acetyl-CoA acetyltransferase